MSKGKGWGGARRGSGKKKGISDAWIRALYKKRNQKLVIPFKRDSLENAVKAMDQVADWLLANEIDAGRASIFNSLMRTQVEILIPTEQQLKVKVLEDKTAQHEKLLGITREDRASRNKSGDTSESRSSRSSTVDSTEQDS